MWVRRVGAVVGAVRGGLRCRVGGEGGGAGSDGDGRLAATQSGGSISEKTSVSIGHGRALAAGHAVAALVF